MRLVALVQTPDHVCCRYRLAAFQPLLEQAGHRLELRAWPRSWWSLLACCRSLRGCDVLILQRRLYSSWMLQCLRRVVPRLVFDFDDAVFQRDSYAAHRGSGKLERRFAHLIRCADILVAGNTYLAGRALSAGANAGRVQVIPTCVDTTKYPLADHRRDRPGVELVWVGSSSTLKGLEAVKPLLEEIGQGVPGSRLKLVCDRFLTLEHLQVVPCPWTEAREAADIAGADIGISWLPDDSWSKGKCGLKVLQYMAAGLPVVANPVGVQAELVTPGVNGFLARTPAEWVGAIAQLAGDPELRRRMGAGSRQRVEKEFSVAAGAGLWVALLDRMQRSGAAA